MGEEEKKQNAFLDPGRSVEIMFQADFYSRSQKTVLLLPNRLVDVLSRRRNSHLRTSGNARENDKITVMSTVNTCTLIL